MLSSDSSEEETLPMCPLFVFQSLLPPRNRIRVSSEAKTRRSPLLNSNSESSYDRVPILYSSLYFKARTLSSQSILYIWVRQKALKSLLFVDQKGTFIGFQ